MDYLLPNAWPRRNHRPMRLRFPVFVGVMMLAGSGEGIALADSAPTNSAVMLEALRKKHNVPALAAVALKDGAI